MRIYNVLHSLRVFLLLLCLTIWLAPALAFGEGDEDTIDLFNAWQETFSTAGRAPRPLSKIAENVTVITAADIERLNAHTLSDVLQTVPGILLDHLGTPTTFTFFNIQGALNSAVLVLIDGIRQNDFDQNSAFPGLIPVQQIERVEIIKGAASTSWGPALGGVINITTKSPNPERSVAGMVSSSIGSRFTTDNRAELSGTLDRFGYYLTSGHIHSDGLSPNTGTNLTNLYGKFSYLLPGKGTATLGLSHLSARPGLDEGDTAKFGFVHDNAEHLRSNGFLKFSQPLGTNLTLNVDGYVTNRDDHTKYGGRDSQGAITFFNDFYVRDATRGANAQIHWGSGQQNLVAGFEYGQVHAKSGDVLSADPPSYDRTWEQWALYANGAYTIGPLTILPGIRHDLTGISGDNTSYSLGATYQLIGNTLLRAYGAQGYSLSSVRTENTFLQKIKTVQGGVETGEIPYLWLKGTYFYNTLKDSQSGGRTTVTNQTRQGFEIEARTTPLHGFSLTGGYTYLYAEDSDTGKRLKTNSDQSVPPHLVKLALKYDHADLGLRGTLTGNYAWWNWAGSVQAADKGMIWDLHLGWRLRPLYGLTPELFFSGHNLFNGNQTTDTELFNGPPRWFEGGMRVNF